MRSRSELPKSTNNSVGVTGPTGLKAQNNRPTKAFPASPQHNRSVSNNVEPSRKSDDEDEDEDESAEEKGISMDLKIRAVSIVPNFDGFKANVRQLNPRLQPFLVERIGQEQVRRYKKLVENKVKHVHAVRNHKCSSGKNCFALGGGPTNLPPRTSAKDPDAPYTGFQVTGTGSDDETTAFAEGTVTAALFPPGVPLPPVKRLPAEFECSLCFKVKKFQKPSDWTKHVHEDVQPFTCTFANCAEPKSFKRKADWVRHENERHRQLEWWTCNMPDCSHTCYRKDNFVQHLVREHKKPEPKVKQARAQAKGFANTKSRNPRSQGMDFVEDWQASVPDLAQTEIEAMWALVDECHSETTKQPKDEACKFCGNVCNSWKKLTVHLAKHMEQIAMPVLELVKQREVSHDTIISPVEPLKPSQQHFDSPASQLRSENPSLSPSPYNYPSSRSVPTMSSGLQGNYTSVPSAQYYIPTSQPVSNYGLQQSQLSTAFSTYDQEPLGTYSRHEATYPPYQPSPTQHFVPVNTDMTYPPVQPQVQQPYGGSYDSAMMRQRAAANNYKPTVSAVSEYERQQVYSSPIEGMPYVFPDNSGMPQQYAPTSGGPHTPSQDAAQEYLQHQHQQQQQQGYYQQ